MSEDFGWSGDEHVIGDCQDDWVMDALDLAGDDWEERQHLLDELALEFHDEKGEEFHPVVDAEENDPEIDYPDDYHMYDNLENDCPLDGDAESALASCGWGTDEDYGYYGEGE